VEIGASLKSILGVICAFRVDSGQIGATFRHYFMKFVLPLALCASLLCGAVNAAEFTKPQAGRINAIVGRLLEKYHYRQTRLDDNISEIFLKNYLNALDYNHLIFSQADQEEFQGRYGKALDDLTLNQDASPAFKIFDRYLQRLGERHQLVEKLLEDKYDFTSDESVLPNRNKAPWPKDDAEAKELWRLRIKYELLQGKLSKEKPEETLKTISRRYARLEKTMKEFDSEEIMQLYLSSLTRAYDPHTDYMSPTESANFKINYVNLSLSGIGAQLEWDDGYTKIKSLVPGGPAEFSKQLKPNDKIVAVAQGPAEPVDVVEMRLNKVVSMIRGKRGTEVRLTIIPANSPDGSAKKVVTIIRDEIKLTEQYAKGKVVEETDVDGHTHRLGLVTLPNFYENCSGHVEKIISRLKKENVDGMILDLRRNGGGILDEAIKLTGLFIKKGPVVQVKDHAKQIQVLADDDSKVVYDGPLVVLVSRLSASASEITAAALQDYGRALIVGDQATHGKGTVQTILALERFLNAESVPQPGELKVTISKFYRVAGGTTQKQGLTPDIVLPSLYDHLELGEANLDNALEADSIKPAEYAHLDRVQPYLPSLQRDSKERVSHDRDFSYLEEDIRDVIKHRADKNISLNEAKRLEEKNQIKIRTEERKKERASRKPLLEKNYEVTLEMVDKSKPLVQAVPPKPKEPDTTASNDVADPATEAELDAEPPVDAHLVEGLHILDDYIKLLTKPGKTVADKFQVSK
jgi:carboxyl-terminal processing protease